MNKILIIIILSLVTTMTIKRLNIIGLIISLIITFVVSFYVMGEDKERLVDMLQFSVISLVLTFILLIVWDCKKDAKKKLRKEFRVELLLNTGKKLYIDDVNRGVAIFGSSGAGKTESVILQLLKHFSKNGFVGVINDYKDYELTEIAYPLFEEQGINFKIFAIHDVNRSVRINPIEPKLIKTEADVNSLVSSLILNLFQDEAGGNEKFFRDGSESLIAGVIWRLKKDFPDKCNLPFLIAFLLSAENHHQKLPLPDGTILVKPFQKLVDFICQDHRAEIAASVFLTGVSSERQTAALYSTLAAGLRKLASPEIFYLLEKNEMNLDLNAEGNRTVLSFINQPGKKENIIAPVNAMLIEACFGQMSERGRKPAFVLLDEAPTIKIMGLGRKIATLRSYGMSFVYCMQDKVQGITQWEGKEYKVKEILTNLSTQFMGKANDPDTAKYYEKFAEIIEETQVSVSKTDSWFASNNSDTRVTESKRDKSKRRAYEYFQLEQGEFVMFNDGKDAKFKFFHKEPLKKKPFPFREITSSQLEANYERILNEAHNFLK